MCDSRQQGQRGSCLGEQHVFGCNALLSENNPTTTQRSRDKCSLDPRLLSAQESRGHATVFGGDEAEHPFTCPQQVEQSGEWIAEIPVLLTSTPIQTHIFNGGVSLVLK
mmetsp:Transcript_4508/g.17059  ORF Transcript_4508/g.17059 Transcript_4508/m.17059 type:complete len:109 (-) Transcript_4508:110-436(-)